MTFGDVIELCKQGWGIRRTSWASDELVVCVQQHIAPLGNPLPDALKARLFGEPLMVATHWGKTDAFGRWNPGWVPTSDEMLSSDWEVLVAPTQAQQPGCTRCHHGPPHLVSECPVMGT